jgi:hypothetical protein
VNFGSHTDQGPVLGWLVHVQEQIAAERELEGAEIRGIVAIEGRNVPDVQEGTTRARIAMPGPQLCRSKALEQLCRPMRLEHNLGILRRRTVEERNVSAPESSLEEGTRVIPDDSHVPVGCACLRVEEGGRQERTVGEALMRGSTNDHLVAACLHTAQELPLKGF